MQVWYDFVDDRIKAMYFNCKTKTEKWKDLGYTKFNKVENWMTPMESPVNIIPPTIIMGMDGKRYTYNPQTSKWEEVV